MKTFLSRIANALEWCAIFLLALVAVQIHSCNAAHAEARRYELRITYRCAGHWNTATYDFRSLPRAIEAMHVFEKWPRFHGAKISVRVK